MQPRLVEKSTRFKKYAFFFSAILSFLDSDFHFLRLWKLPLSKHLYSAAKHQKTADFSIKKRLNSEHILCGWVNRLIFAGQNLFQSWSFECNRFAYLKNFDWLFLWDWERVSLLTFELTSLRKNRCVCLCKYLWCKSLYRRDVWVWLLHFTYCILYLYVIYSTVNHSFSALLHDRTWLSNVFCKSNLLS